MKNNRLHLIRLFGSAVLGIQGLFCLIWWLKMFTDPAMRVQFVWAGVPEAAFFAFTGPDILLYAGGSFASAFALSGSKPWAMLAVGITTGAILYAECLAIGLSVLTDSAWAGAVLMAPSAIFMAFMAAATYRMEAAHVLVR